MNGWAKEAKHHTNVAHQGRYDYVQTQAPVVKPSEANLCPQGEREWRLRTRVGIDKHHCLFRIGYL